MLTMSSASSKFALTFHHEADLLEEKILRYHQDVDFPQQRDAPACRNGTSVRLRPVMEGSPNLQLHRLKALPGHCIHCQRSVHTCTTDDEQTFLTVLDMAADARCCELVIGFDEVEAGRAS
jgi:hypothetical protein